MRRTAKQGKQCPQTPQAGQAGYSVKRACVALGEDMHVGCLSGERSWRLGEEVGRASCLDCLPVKVWV